MIATAADRGTIASGWGEARVVVVTLCAAWCDTCTEFRAAFERIAGMRRDALFIWLDIEDDAAICGDIDVENFPSLAIYRGAALLHYGVSLPQEGTVARLVDEMAGRSEPQLDAPAPVLALPKTLRKRGASDR